MKDGMQMAGTQALKHGGYMFVFVFMFMFMFVFVSVYETSLTSQTKHVLLMTL